MTKHIVADDILGTISRRSWEIQRRVMEGTLDPSFVTRNQQRIAEAQEVEISTPNSLIISPFFASEEIASNYSYPEGYAVKPICEQLVVLAKHFPNLNSSPVLACSKELPALSTDAEGWFVVPRFEKVAGNYNEAVEKVLGMIGSTRIFHNYRKGQSGPKYLRQSDRTTTALQMLGAKQQGDYLLIPAQFGLRHRGRSTRRVREIIGNSNEFGLGIFVTGCMLLSHPERLVKWEQLHIDCPGDEYSPGADGEFSVAPIFYFHDGRVKFDTYWVGDPGAHCGSASGFLPQ